MWKIPGLVNIRLFVSYVTEFDLSHLFNGINQLYNYLSAQMREATRSFISPKLYEEWEYAVDPSTGLDVLIVKKDSTAMSKISKIAEELYK